MRFLNPGPGLVLKNALDGREATPTESLDKVQPGFEVRALRPWEFFAEKIFRWSAVMNAVASVGNFSTVVFGAIPLGTILVIDDIINNSTIAVQLRPGGDPAGAVSSSRIVPSDSRWGIGIIAPPNTLENGASAAPGGLFHTEIPVGAIATDIGLVSQAAESTGIGILPWTNNAIVIAGAVVNTAIRVTVRGRLILYRVRG